MKLRKGTNFTVAKSLDALAKLVAIFALNVEELLNGGLRLDENFAGQVLVVEFTSTTQKTIQHQLNRVPTGYFIVGSTTDMRVYDGTIRSTKDTIYLRPSAVGTARIFIY